VSAQNNPEKANATGKKGPVPAEALILRGAPERSVRLSRPAILAGSTIALVAISASLWMAFGRSPERSAYQSNHDELPATPAAVRGLPSTYDFPMLGPELPGDLGRPILARQKRSADFVPPDTVQQDNFSNAPDPDRELRRAARGAGLMVPVNASPADAQGSGGSDGGAEPPLENAPRLALVPDTDPNAQQRKSDFLADNASSIGVNPHALTPAASPYVVTAGSIISGSLLTGIESDLPGLVTAQITERVFDSATGTILLIPQGSRLIGKYDSVVAYGQKRAFVLWQRLMFPDGSALAIENVPATDPSGKSGLVDRVNAHALALLQSAAISTILGVGTNLGMTGESDLVQALRESAQQNVSQAGDQLVSRTLQIQPSISIRPGAPVRMIVHRDLLLRPWSR
jgi:type IV secretory pathway VirB10-like protein